MEYTVLKKFTAANGAKFKEGDVVNSEDTTLSPEGIAQLIVDGLLDPIIDPALYETIVVDEAYLAAHPDEAANGIKLGDEITRLKVEPATVSDEEQIAKAEADAKAKAEADEAAAADESNSEATPAKLLIYRGQQVISDGMREVNGISYHHVRLADGSSNDVLDDEYEAMVANAQ